MVEQENGPDEYIHDLRQDIFERFNKLRKILEIKKNAQADNSCYPYHRPAWRREDDFGAKIEHGRIAYSRPRD